MGEVHTETPEPTDIGRATVSFGETVSSFSSAVFLVL